MNKNNRALARPDRKMRPDIIWFSFKTVFATLQKVSQLDDVHRVIADYPGNNFSHSFDVSLLWKNYVMPY